MAISLEEIQGNYDIVFQTTPQRPEWYEPGYGTATIKGNTLSGIDATGISWFANLQLVGDTIVFDATLDATNAPLDSGLIDENGKFTRGKQNYKGELYITRAENILILRTVVKQGDYTVNVQFRKKI